MNRAPAISGARGDSFQGSRDGLFLGTVPPQFAGFVNQAVVDRQVRGHCSSLNFISHNAMCSFNGAALCEIAVVTSRTRFPIFANRIRRFRGIFEQNTKRICKV
jgi:hypothetical protein